MHLGGIKSAAAGSVSIYSGFHLWSIKDLRVNARVTYTSETDERKKQHQALLLKHYCAGSSPFWVPFLLFYCLRVILILRSIFSKT